MRRNKVYAIVEGHGEAQPPPGGREPAVHILIARLLHALNCWTLFPGKKYSPFRLSSSGSFFRAGKLENTIRLHKKYEDCAAVLILVDMEDHCAKDKAFEITGRISRMEPLPFSVAVVCAVREYESWFLASLESIANRSYGDKPEKRRNAKGWLNEELEYREVHDQAGYTKALDIDLALARSRSFRRLYHAFEEIVAAAEQGEAIITPLATERQ